MGRILCQSRMGVRMEVGSAWCSARSKLIPHWNQRQCCHWIQKRWDFACSPARAAWALSQISQTEYLCGEGRQLFLGWWDGGAVLATAAAQAGMEGDVEGACVWRQVLDWMAQIELIPHFRVPALENVFSWCLGCWAWSPERTSLFSWVPNGWEVCPCEKLECLPSLPH